LIEGPAAPILQDYVRGYTVQCLWGVHEPSYC
jgi:hypothetical protein